MLQLNFIRENKKDVISGLKKRGFNNFDLIENILCQDDLRKKTQAILDDQLSKANLIAKKIGLLLKSGEKEKAEILKSKSIDLKKNNKELEETLNKIEDELTQLRYQIPNVPNKIVIKGFSEKDNQEIEKFGKFPKLNQSNCLPHWELAKKYNLIDFDLGSKITGAGFPVYIDKGAKLQRALINYFLDKNISSGYKEIQAPYLVNEESGIGTGQLPDKDGQMYHIIKDDLYLIPTAEVPLTNIFRNEIIEEKDLPICLTGYTPCFRREAGSYGSDVRGLNRLHQFDKVEVIRIETPGNSEIALKKMIQLVKKILLELKLHSRIIRLCGGDLGFTSSITYDFEVFSAAQKKWLEVSSVSNFNNFQAERLKLRYRKKSGLKNLVHTLNGSSLALPRVIAALLENNQTKDGIVIPKTLVPYTGFDLIS